MQQNEIWDGEEFSSLIVIPSEMDGTRVDAALAKLTEQSRSAIERLIDGGQIFRGETAEKAGKLTKKDKVKAGETYTVLIPPPEDYDVQAEEMALEIVYEDGDILVVNKPQGMVVHPAPGHTTGTLVNGLLWHCGDSLSGVGGVKRPGIVHRIDRDTSGLLCVAKNDMAHAALSAQLSDHTMHREYRTLVIGGLPEEKGTINAPIARHPADRKKMAIVKDGRHAVTHYTSLGKMGGITDCSVVLETGRTHQIRVHMAYIGHPVLGDPVYGGENHPFVKKHPALFHGQMLHAAALVLIHPATGEKMRFTCSLPTYYTEALRLLEESER